MFGQLDDIINVGLNVTGSPEHKHGVLLEVAVQVCIRTASALFHLAESRRFCLSDAANLSRPRADALWGPQLGDVALEDVVIADSELCIAL